MNKECPYNLKIGDMIESGRGYGIVTKITAKHYHYNIFKHKTDCGRPPDFSFVHRVHRDTFWSAVDSPALSARVHYSLDMKWRRKRKISA